LQQIENTDIDDANLVAGWQPDDDPELVNI
jgi:hypothetical protein